MQFPRRAFFFGLLVWAIPFVVAMFIFPIRESNRPLFESIMPVAVVFSTMVFAKLYFKEAKGDLLKEGVKLGLVWLVISLAIDLLMFSRGPMAMTLRNYIADIGITYLIIPIMTIGMGCLLEKAK